MKTTFNCWRFSVSEIEKRLKFEINQHYFLNFEFFSSMNDVFFFKNIMLIFISNNFHLWIEEFKYIILKIKMWQYINSNDNMKKSKKRILFEIDHFSIKNSNSQSITDDLMTNQTIFAATSHFRFTQWLYELISS
jgi:hypothetical protein